MKHSNELSEADFNEILERFNQREGDSIRPHCVAIRNLDNRIEILSFSTASEAKTFCEIMEISNIQIVSEWKNNIDNAKTGE